MDEFDPKLFEELRKPWRFREGSLKDLKEKLPVIVGKGLDLNSLRNFIVDMIAFANTARRRGEPAYILYGVKNNGDIVGIRGQCTRMKVPSDWDDNDPDKFERQQNEIIGRELHQVIEIYVQGGIEFNYRPGWVNGELVSYIQIWSGNTPHFEVKKELNNRAIKEKLLRRGDCWKREGESNIYVPENEKEFLYSHRKIPYLPNIEWVNHLERLAREMLPDEDNDNIYLPLRIEEKEASSLDEEVDQFLASETQSGLLIIGRPGIGKTTFLNRLVGRLAGQMLIGLETTHQLVGYVPILFNLSQFVAEDGSFARQLTLALDKYKIFRLNEYEAPERILLDRNIQFLICLDAFDEIDVGEGHIRALDKFLQENIGPKNSKVIITSRPEALPKPWLKRYQILHIAPLTENQVFDYLFGRLNKAQEVFELLQNVSELLDLMCTPLLLEKIVEYLETDESNLDAVDFLELTTGRFMYTLFEGLLDHEEEKVMSLDRWQQKMSWQEGLSKLALWIDGRVKKHTSIAKAKEYLGKELLTVQNLGILQRHKNSSLKFFNLLVLAYFAALRIGQIIEEEDNGIDQVVKKLSGDVEFWDKCLDLLTDLVEEDITPLKQKFLMLKGANHNG
jgi:nucleoside-triphosphatase THEP1